MRQRDLHCQCTQEPNGPVDSNCHGPARAGSPMPRNYNKYSPSRHSSLSYSTHHHKHLFLCCLTSFRRAPLLHIPSFYFRLASQEITLTVHLINHHYTSTDYIHSLSILLTSSFSVRPSSSDILPTTHIILQDAFQTDCQRACVLDGCVRTE